MAYDVGNPVPGFIYCWQPISTDDAILFLSPLNVKTLLQGSFCCNIMISDQLSAEIIQN
jgi:hypothetical protein